MPIVWKAWGFFKRDFFADLSYKLSFAFQIVDVLIGLGAYYFLARLIGPGAFHGYRPFPFLLVGVAVNGYMSTSLICYSHSIRGSHPLGTLKMVLATPTSPVGFVLYSSIYPLVRAGFDAFLYLLGGLLMGLSLSRVNIPVALLVFILSEFAFSSIGILSATFTLVFKRGDPLLWLFGAFPGCWEGSTTLLMSSRASSAGRRNCCQLPMRSSRCVRPCWNMLPQPHFPHKLLSWPHSV